MIQIDNAISIRSQASASNFYRVPKRSFKSSSATMSMSYRGGGWSGGIAAGSGGGESGKGIGPGEQGITGRGRFSAGSRSTPPRELKFFPLFRTFAIFPGSIVGRQRKSAA